MTRKKFMKLRNELCRRVWLQQRGNLKGFGKAERYMQGKRPNFETLQQLSGDPSLNSYEAVWSCEAFRLLRETVGM